MTQGELNLIAQLLHAALCTQITPLNEAKGIARELADGLRAQGYNVPLDFESIITHCDGASLDKVPMHIYPASQYLALFNSIKPPEAF